MTHFSFFWRHALNNMNRNRQRTMFVLFCIAAGVAAVVSLRTLGLMIQDALLENLQADLRGDIRISAPSEFGVSVRELELDESLVELGTMFLPSSFTPKGLEAIGQWALENEYEISPALYETTPLQIRKAVDPDKSETLQLYFVDPNTYPFYNDFELIEPAQTLLGDAFKDELDIVLTVKLATALGVGVGEQVRLSGSRDPFTVTALIDDTAEASLSNFSSVLIPFAYLSFETGQTRFNRQANTIFVKTPPESDVIAIEKSFESEFPGIRMRTTDDLREDNIAITSWLTKLITTTGLVSLLIGGIGIVNTMLVVVRRRTKEIGVLKTIGLQGNQISLMFFLEALVLGVVGSMLGGILGLGLTRILQSVGEQIAARSLTFRIYPEALLMGLIVGTLVTLVFGLLPTLAAGRVRPNVVLNPSDTTQIPQGTLWQSGLIIAGLTFVMGLIVAYILDDFWLGTGGTFGTFILLGVAALLMWVVILFVTIFPSFGSINIKLAQRAMGTQRGRAASTLLALAVGMFALSFILLLTQSILNILNTSFDQQLGGNIVAVGQTYDSVAEIQDTLSTLPGINEVEFAESFNGELIAINDTAIEELTEAAKSQGIAARRDQSDVDLDSLSLDELEDERQRWRTRANVELRQFTDTMFLQEEDETLVYTPQAGGRRVSAEDDHSIVIRTSDAVTWLGIELGDTLTFEFDNGEQTTLNIIGIMPEVDVMAIVTADNSNGNTFPAGSVVSADAIPPSVNPQPGAVIIDADADVLPETVAAISEVPNAIVFEASLIQSFLSTILEQLTALPMVVAVLALFASGVNIANTVSLATLERQREIGIMKAIGMSSRQVLGLLMLENGLLGLLGGVLGTSIGAAASLLTVLSDDGAVQQFPFGTLLGLIALAVVIALAATLITAWGASRTKPLIVLRYE